MPERLKQEKEEEEKIFYVKRGKYVESGKSVSARVKNCVRRERVGGYECRLDGEKMFFQAHGRLYRKYAFDRRRRPVRKAVHRQTDE